ncbi:MAG: radical SAM/SPASM domain-containing protein [Syntrophales bacterium]
MNFGQIWRYVPDDVLVFLLRQGFVRDIALKNAVRQLYNHFVVVNEENWPVGIQEVRYKLVRNLLLTLDKAFSEGRISQSVCKSLVRNLIGMTIMGEKERTEQCGFFPPALLTISPTQRCNLMCKGCYAASSSGTFGTLKFEIFDRIISEAKELWRAHLTVISGGEPLLYRDGEKTLFNILERHRDNYFMMYTNGTLISRETARRMAEVGNISPAISVEGFEKQTDARRGKGVFRKIDRAMDNLRKEGVPFGVSVTATRENADLVLSDELIDHYFQEKGAFYGWVFQYMPIGRSYTVDLMVTPDQRRAMFMREQEVVNNRQLFLVDFWNGGPYSLGCISAGRRYFYIDWNGNIAPCVFFPYYLANIYDLYGQNKTLNDVLFSPYFESIRKWQDEYGYDRRPDRVKNWIVPCLIRDHYEEAYKLMNEFHVKPMDAEAGQALQDEDYRKKMIEYGNRAREMTQEIWDREFLKNRH